jgi:hypothetical protein
MILFSGKLFAHSLGVWIQRLVQDVALAKLRTIKEEFQKHFDLTVLLLTNVWPLSLVAV